MKKRLLYWGDSPRAQTGYGTVANGILQKLSEEYDISIIGVNDRGGYADPEEWPFKIYPAIWNNFNDALGVNRFAAVMMEADKEIKGQFDVVLIQLPTWNLAECKWNDLNVAQYLHIYAKQKWGAKVIFYTPIEAGFLDGDWIESLKPVDKIVVPTHWGKQIIKRYSEEAWNKTEVIYYGIDTDNFRPLPVWDKEKIKATMGDKFVIGFVGSNQWRKDQYHLIKAFARFHRDHPNSALYLHCLPEGGSLYSYNCLELLRREGLFLGKDYSVPSRFAEAIGLERSEMNIVYNMMDVHLSFSMGEGFSLPMVEAMLAGVPNIYPDNSVLPELLNFKGKYDVEFQAKTGRGLIFENAYSTCWGNLGENIEYQIGSVEDAVAKLEWVYKNRESEELKGLTKRAREWAMTLTGEKMGQEFSWLIAKLLNS